MSKNLMACYERNIFSDFKHKAPFVGYFNFTTPYLLIIDPGLAKQIMIKDFKNFRNNEFSSLVSESVAAKTKRLQYMSDPTDLLISHFVVSV
jgi:hypothetical protein